MSDSYMKDASDTQTLDLIPTPKKRGRPSTGNALSAAERKRKQRRKAELRYMPGSSLEIDAHMATLSTTALCDTLSKMVSSGFVVFAEDVCRELMRRAQDRCDERCEEDQE